MRAVAETKPETAPDLARIRAEVSSTLAQLDSLKRYIDSLRARTQEEFDRTVEQLQFTGIKREYLADFLKEPYVLIPKRENEWYVIVPKWVPFSVGWLERSTPSYNLFVINRYVKWFTEIPASLEGKLRFETPLPFKVYNGVLLTGREHLEEAVQRYRNFVSTRMGDDRLRVKQRGASSSS